MTPSDFWHEWLGLGRGVGNPWRSYIAKPEDFQTWIGENEKKGLPSYTSVQPFKAYEDPFCIEKLFFDFDCKKDPEKAGDEARLFARRLEKFYEIESLLVFSGNKGYHLYVFLELPFGVGMEILALKSVYMRLQRMLVGKAKYETLDSSVLGDIKQLARIPYTHHERTGKLCAFVDDNRTPIMVNPGFTKVLRENGLSFELCKNALYKVGREEKERCEQKATKPRSTRHYDRTIRPCIKTVLDSGNIHTPEHLMKLATVAEFNANGWGLDRIIGAFRGMSGFDERKTSYFVRHAIRTGYKPFRCTKIQSIGGCLGSDCAIYRRARPHHMI